MSNLLAALGLMLVLEGLLPLIAPQSWRDTFRKITDFRDGQIRTVGLISIVAGLLVLVFSR